MRTVYSLTEADVQRLLIAQLGTPTTVCESVAMYRDKDDKLVVDLRFVDDETAGKEDRSRLTF